MTEPPTDAEREYMNRAMTAEERAATKGMPQHVAVGWVVRQRAHHLADKRGEARTERIFEAFVQLAEAMRS